MEKVIDENKPKEAKLKVGDYVYEMFRDRIGRRRIARTTKTMAIDDRENKYDIVAKYCSQSNHYKVRKKGNSYEKYSFTFYFLEDDDLLRQLTIYLMKGRIRSFDWDKVNDIEKLTKVIDIINSIKND